MITIRPAEPGDAPALGRLGALLMRTHYDFDRQRFMNPGAGAEQGYARFLLSQLDDADVVVLVADQAGAVVGYVYAGVEPRSWKELRDEAGFIHDIAVAEDARAIGIGRQLLDAALDWLRSRGMLRAVLWTASPNATARRLFERRGFRATMTEMTLEL
jgi:GNAT superfamily N-acetyltransferase